MNKFTVIKKMMLIPMMAGILCITGCGSEITLNSEQNDLIAEYAGGVLMKYSHANEWDYYKLGKNITNFTKNEAQLIQPQQPTQAGNKPTTQTPTQNGGSTGPTAAANNSSGSLADLAAALQMPGISISYGNSVVAKSYPQEELLSVAAVKNKDILAVEFNLTNTTSEEVVCNTATLGVILKLSVNDSGNVIEYATMLKNDINMLKNVAIAPQETYKAVALFMVPEGRADEITSLTLTVSGQGVSTSKIKLR